MRTQRRLALMVIVHECLVMQAQFLLNETKVRKDKFLYYEGKARVHVHCSSSTRNGMISFHRLPVLNTHASVS